MEGDGELSEVLPEPGRLVDPDADIAAESRPAPSDRPWVLANMITSLDGTATVQGQSGALGRPADKAVFSALRAVADVIIVGAATVIAEDYRPTGARLADVRLARGQQPRPTVAILSASLSIDPDHRVFGDPTNRPVIITSGDAPTDRRTALAEVADLVDAGRSDLDIGAALRILHERGHRLALLEGGPTLNGHFVAADTIDEWNLSLSPILAGGDGPRAAHGSTPDATRDFELMRLWTGDGLLFGRWVRSRG